MKKNLFKSLTFILFSILFLAPLNSVSAAIYQKPVFQNTTAAFKQKKKIKQSFFQKFIQKRIEKAFEKQVKSDFEQEQPNQTVGIIAILSLFVGVVLLLASTGIGFLLIFAALLLSIIGLITEDKPTYSRRAFWISLFITIYFLARYRSLI
jgi:ABC-type bacteriocin/lantibiotic exporter with double-glycine peptidase domain